MLAGCLSLKTFTVLIQEVFKQALEILAEAAGVVLFRLRPADNGASR